MTVSCDAHYIQGDNHKYCQDYALSGNSCGMFYTVLSDGCSGAKDTDIGSRVLCRVAKEQLLSSLNFNFKERGIFEKIAQEAYNKIHGNQGLGFTRKEALAALSATLLFFFYDEETDLYCCGIGGDGSVVLKNRTEKYCFSFEYPNNTPFYPIYYLSLPEENIKSLCDSLRITFRVFDENNKEKEVIHNLLNNDFNTMFSDIMKNRDNPVNSITLFSDGINAIQSNNEEPPELTFSNYLVRKGLFVQRAMQFAVKMGRKKHGLRFYDDISSGSVLIDE